MTRMRTSVTEYLSKNASPAAAQVSLKMSMQAIALYNVLILKGGGGHKQGVAAAEERGQGSKHIFIVVYVCVIYATVKQVMMTRIRTSATDEKSGEEMINQMREEMINQLMMKRTRMMMLMTLSSMLIVRQIIFIEEIKTQTQVSISSLLLLLHVSDIS